MAILFSVIQAAGEAMSHKEVLEKVLEASVVPFLVKHHWSFYKDRHLHKKNPKKLVHGCPCCIAKTSMQRGGCTECITAWKLTMVSRVFHEKVMAYSNTLSNYWWVWTPEYRLYKSWKGPNPYENKGKGKGYEPQGGSQPQDGLACLVRALRLMTRLQPTGWLDDWMAEQGEAFDVPVASYYTTPIVAPTELDSLVPTPIVAPAPIVAPTEEDPNWESMD